MKKKKNIMARFINKRKEDIGLSPDALLFRGEQKVMDIRLRLIDFDPNGFEEAELKAISSVAEFQKKDTVTWLNIDGLHDVELMKEVAEMFELDHLILSDVMNTGARPAVSEYPNCIYVSIKMIQEAQEGQGAKRISVENLSLILTESVLISFQERKGDVFEPVRERIRAQKKRIRNSGTDYLMFALLDIVVDNYLYILSELGEKIETLEDNLLLEPNQEMIDQLNSYKRELNFLRRNIKPAREMIFSLTKIESDLINESIEVHLKELRDNIIQASDVSDSYREMLTDLLNIYHTTVSTKLNDIMKFLTVFSAIFIPLTFIAGIYGTNFEYLPELHFKYSYFVMLGIMFAVAAGMVFYFKKQKWL
ncbi:magnesium/cobalt transporter CorA [Flammeovirgaceae bacterium SG7u.111]|nr:magnesium/cobalt transporter CorA [Flammeovirgaceae bacterium SG7u.132]WPO38007.1 magnesium/cobalt transporter CorA [Flammeovirgaceae bacterium SG7u.111]